MKLMFLSEYLDLIAGGTSDELIALDFSDRALKIAEDLWPSLKLQAWDERVRSVASVKRGYSSQQVLCRVTADTEGSHLILVFDPAGQVASDYLLFDDAARFTAPRILCPSFRVEAVANDTLVEVYLPMLQKLKDDQFVIVHRGDGEYMQAYYFDSKYDVEFQLVSTASHYRLDKPVDAESVVSLFRSYVQGNDEWLRNHRWKKLNLP